MGLHEQMLGVAIDLGKAASWWRVQAESMERQRDEAFAALARSEAERDAYHKRFSDVLKEHHEFMNDMLSALDLEIDEDGEYILDQIVMAARTARDGLARSEARAVALTESARLMVSLLEDWHRLVSDIVEDGDAGSHVGRLGVRDFRELFARYRALREALGTAGGGAG